jgi:deazaflavin-dependent oxidoreductase (nitroreductase family)
VAVHSRGYPLERLRALELITRGRKTGRARRVELWFVFRDGAVYLLSGTGSRRQGTHWFRNLVADPRVVVEARGQSWEGVAEVLQPDWVDVITGWFREKYGPEVVRRRYEGTARIPVRVRLRNAESLTEGGD